MKIKPHILEVSHQISPINMIPICFLLVSGFLGDPQEKVGLLEAAGP